MAEMIWKIGFDEKAAVSAGKKAGKAQADEASKGKNQGILQSLAANIKDLQKQREESTDIKEISNLNKQIKNLKSNESKIKGEKKDSAFAGGFLGSILGNLLASVKQLFDPLTAIAGLLIAALFPILKPFLILFIKVGLLLYKWLQSSLTGLGSTEAGVQVNADTGQATVGDSLKSALFIIGGIIAAIVAALAGAPVLLTAAIAVLSGLLVSQVGAFLIQMLLNFVSWLDGVLGTNFLEPLINIFNGIANVFNGLWNILAGLLTLDFSRVWEGLKQVLLGLWQIIKGVFLFAWEQLKAIIIISFNVLKSIGTWIKDKIKGFFGFGGGGSSDSVNDAIITPNGDIIRTSPSDYLIATKNPSSLNSIGGTSKAINVNINGGLITEDVAKQIGKIIQREINYGGGF